MATRTIGFTKEKSFDLGGQTVTFYFWALEEIRNLKDSARQAELVLVPFQNKQTFLDNPHGFYSQGKIVFRFNPSNWPFTKGSCQFQSFYDWLKLQYETENQDGETMNGGIDWTTATEETVEV